MRLFFCFLIISIFLVGSPAFALTSDDPYRSQQWYLDAIGAPAAWDWSTGSRDVVIAVLDTGVDLDHPDLIGNIWTNPGEAVGDGRDNDGNGFVDDIHGWDFIEDDSSPIPDSDSAFDEEAVAHGTAIAGTIGAAGNNAVGITGLNWSVRIMPLRILDNLGEGDSKTAIRAVDYAVANGADIINLSFTGFQSEDEFKDSLRRAYDAGVLVVAAVGNQSGGGLNINEKPIYPACYGEQDEDDWIIGVTATTQTDEKTSFSNYGSDCSDIAAPGTEIFSTYYNDVNWSEYAVALYANGWSGTSFAVPMVSGAAGLLKSAYPDLTPKQLKIILQLSVDPVRATGALVGQMGSGRINVARAFEVVKSFVPSFAMATSSIVRLASTQIVVSPEGGTPPSVRVLSKSGTPIRTFDAYASAFAGGVRSAVGDVDGDGVDEIVTVTGDGSAHVRIFEMDGAVLDQFFAYDTKMRAGMFVATGDVDGDGTEEIALTTDTGGTGELLIVTRSGEVKHRFFPFGQTSVSLRVALGDVNGDGVDEVIVGRGAGTRSDVAVFSPDGNALSTMLAYAPTYDRGIFVASGDLDGDGDDEIVTGTDNGGGPQVQIFDGKGKLLGTFFAYDRAFRGGVRVAIGTLSTEKGAAASIITSAGPGGGPHVRVYNGYAKLIGAFFAGETTDRQGINVSASSL